MLKVDRLHNKVEPFAALFWALGIVYLAPDPARRHSTAVHKACPSMVMLPVQWWWRVGLILKEDSCPLPLSYLDMLFIYGVEGQN